MYLLLGILTTLMVLIRGIFVALFARKNSIKLFNKLLYSILRSPLCIIFTKKLKNKI